MKTLNACVRTGVLWVKGIVCLGVGVAVVAVLPQAASALAASTLYVGSGRGGGHCGRSSYSTIQSAIDDANPGDTVKVCTGTYDEVVDITKPLTLEGFGHAVIKPDNTTALLDQGVRRVAVYIEDGVDGVTIRRLTIDGTGGTVHYGIYGFNTDNDVVEENTVHDITNETADPVLDVAGVGILFFGWGQGIDNVTVERNRVYNTGRMGIFIGGMQGADPYAWLLSNDDVISRNFVRDTWQGPTADHGGAVQMNGEKDALIERNVVEKTGQPTGDDSYSGIYLFGTVAGTLSRNIVLDNLYGLSVWVNPNSTYPNSVDFGAETPSEPTLEHNVLANNSVANVSITP